MSTTSYSVGTVSVANGGTTVTGVGTAWAGKVFAGDLFTDPAQGLFSRVTADAASDTEIAINAWPGTALSEDAYELLFMPDGVRASERTRQLLEQLSVVSANGRGLFFRFSDTTTDADPGAGVLRLNHATVASATAAYIDNLDANGATVSGEIDTWDDSSSSTKGRLWLRSVSNPAAFHSFTVSGAVVDGTGYRKLTLAHVGGSGSFADGEELMAFFVPIGAQGAGYEYSAEVADPSGLTDYEEEGEGYRVFVQDLGGVYAGRSGVVRLNSEGEWDLAAIYTGEKGAKGDKGWAPLYSGATDGARRVLRLVSYTGGEGSAPTANIGQYLKADGTFTATIGDAMDIRGDTGPGFNWAAAYDSEATYAVDDVVRSGGSAWIALLPNTGNPPPSLPVTINTYWELFASKGTDGAGTGDMTGDAGGSAIGNIPVFDSTSGKSLEDSGTSIDDIEAQIAAIPDPVAMAIVFGA